MKKLLLITLRIYYIAIKICLTPKMITGNYFYYMLDGFHLGQLKQMPRIANKKTKNQEFNPYQSN